MMNNLTLIINIIEKRRSKASSQTQQLLNTNEEFNTHKVYKGYTILALSKNFWDQRLRMKQIYEMNEAIFHKPASNFNIEDKYVTLIERRCLKKNRDP